MLRRIVQVRSHEYLQAAWSTKSFAAAGAGLQRDVQVAGMGFEESKYPTPNSSKLAVWSAGPATMTRAARPRTPAPATYNFVAQFDDEEAIARLKFDRRHEVIEVYADLEIAPVAGPYTGQSAVGTEADVQRLAGVRALRAHQLTGTQVRVVIVDTGIDGQRLPVDPLGWVPSDVQYQVGTADGLHAALGHGTMCAHDVRLTAPQTTLHDFALLRSPGNLARFLSDALTAFASLADLLEGAWAGQPVVVNNSWAVFNRSADEPPGSPGNYSSNLNHPVNQQIGALAALGADVLFAAGNCGQPRPDGRCGAADQGPARSIHGANSHPDVLTVSGVTVDDRRLAYSSQGPGALSSRKPDLAVFTHFKSTSAWALHSGTSAACPVLAGIVAALRTSGPGRSMSPANLKSVLQRTARNPIGAGWESEFGYGIVDVAGALASLGFAVGPAAAAAASTTPRKRRVKKTTRKRKPRTKRHR